MDMGHMLPIRRRFIPKATGSYLTDWRHNMVFRLSSRLYVSSYKVSYHNYFVGVPGASITDTSWLNQHRVQGMDKQ